MLHTDFGSYATERKDRNQCEIKAETQEIREIEEGMKEHR